MSEWEELAKWLAKLQPGDEVAIRHGYGRLHRLATVDRMTKTLIVAGNVRFNRKDGRAAGSGYDRSSLVRPTPEIKQRLAFAEAASMLQHQVQWGQMPEDVVTECAKIVRQARLRANPAPDAR